MICVCVLDNISLPSTTKVRVGSSSVVLKKILTSVVALVPKLLPSNVMICLFPLVSSPLVKPILGSKLVITGLSYENV